MTSWIEAFIFTLDGFGGDYDLESVHTFRSPSYTDLSFTLSKIPHICFDEKNVQTE